MHTYIHTEEGKETTSTFLCNADLHLPFHFWIIEPPSNVPLGGSEGVVRVGYRLRKACVEKRMYQGALVITHECMDTHTHIHTHTFIHLPMYKLSHHLLHNAKMALFNFIKLRKIHHTRG